MLGWLSASNIGRGGAGVPPPPPARYITAGTPVPHPVQDRRGRIAAPSAQSLAHRRRARRRARRCRSWARRHGTPAFRCAARTQARGGGGGWGGGRLRPGAAMWTLCALSAVPPATAPSLRVRRTLGQGVWRGGGVGRGLLTRL